MAATASTPEGGYVTLEEFERMPEEDEFRVELSRGRIVREPRPGARHGLLAARMVRLLGSAADERGSGPVVTETGFLLRTDPPTVRGPDVAFIALDRATPVPEGFWTVPPTLAVEVVSPSNTAAEIQTKVLEYLEAGTSLVWVVDPATRSVTAWSPTGDAHVYREGETLEAEDVLTGFALPIAEIFSE